MADFPPNIIPLMNIKGMVKRAMPEGFIERKEFDPVRVVHRVSSRLFTRGTYTAGELEQEINATTYKRRTETIDAPALDYLRAKGTVIDEDGYLISEGLPSSDHAEALLETLLQLAISKMVDFNIFIGVNLRPDLEEGALDAANRGFHHKADWNVKLTTNEYTLAAEINNLFVELLIRIYDHFEFTLPPQAEVDLDPRMVAINKIVEDIFHPASGLLVQQFNALSSKQGRRFISSFGNGITAAFTQFIKLRRAFAAGNEGLSLRLPTADEDKAGADLVILDRDGNVQSYVQIKSKAELPKTLTFEGKILPGENADAAVERLEADFSKFLIDAKGSEAEIDAELRKIGPLVRLCQQTAKQQGGKMPTWRWQYVNPDAYLTIGKVKSQSLPQTA